jgi:NFACT protein RNA binding domain
MHHMNVIRQTSFSDRFVPCKKLAFLVAMSWASFRGSALRQLETAGSWRRLSSAQPLVPHRKILSCGVNSVDSLYSRASSSCRTSLSSSSVVGRDLRRCIGAVPLRTSRRRAMSLFATSVDDDEAIGNDTITDRLQSEWNLPALKKETQRLVSRCHKKIGKAHQRLESAQQQVKQLLQDDNASLEQLEACPDVEALQYELQELQTRLQRLGNLESKLQSIKGKTSTRLPEDVAMLAIDLDVSDQPFTPPSRGESKPKGPSESPSSRLPYRRYYSLNNVEIRVGKKATDNDDLTLRSEHRDNRDWWMHASGCPGSHVVIRCQDASLHPEVKMDAAALAARQSKCSTPVIKVSLTRAGDIRKPPGAKAGLVQLVGKVETVVVNMKEAEGRLKRLDATVLVN